MQYIFSLILSLPVVAWANDTHTTFFRVTAENGDGIYALLRRYDVLNEPSKTKFYEMNNIRPDAPLISGRTYNLPVLIYQYNGVSIRSTIGIDDWDLARSIADYNRRMQERGLRTGSYQESKVLWVPAYMLDTRSTPKEAAVRMTASSAALTVPLFGPAHERVEIKSNKLKGRVYFISSGHGGPDPGAITEYNGRTLCEDEYAYDVSLRLAKTLIEHGATVEIIVQDPYNGIRSEEYLKCDKTELLLGRHPIPMDQRLRLRQRVHAINTLAKQYRQQGLRDQTVICIHVDSRNPSMRQDVFFYYYDKSSAGRKLANALRDTFDKKYRENQAGRGYRGTVTSRPLYMLKHTDPRAVYIELANIQNHADLRRILPESNRQALANWLAEGLMSVK